MRGISLIVAALIVAAGVLVAAVLLLNHETYTILLTEKGFEPNYLEVQEGAKVIFKTTRNAPFWPASNIHPTHTVYPDFDPKKPVAPDAQWAYTFTESGTYGFHDHIDPFATGTINVAFSGRSKAYDEDCSEKKQACYDEKLREMTRKEGAKAALSLLEMWYKREPAFRKNCHAYVHSIGQEAYTVYAQDGKVAVSALAEYCGFGFYHGFMESMLHQTGDLEEAKEFCASFDTASDSPGSSTACFHGIGHGVIDGSDPTQWGSASNMIRGGLALCEEVGETYYEKKICGTGVFNALVGLYFDPKYGLTIDREHPYEICAQQEQEYFREACHEDMNTLVWRISGNDFKTAIGSVAAIQDDQHAYLAARSLALVAGSQAAASTQEGIEACLSLKRPLQGWCIEGFAGGIIESGTAEVKFSAAFDFCDNAALNADLKDRCYKNTASLLQRIAPPSVHEFACAEGERRYQEICTK